MAKHVTIKEVEGEYIWLEEVNRSKLNLLTLLITFGILFVLSLIIGCGIPALLNIEVNAVNAVMSLLFTSLIMAVIVIPIRLCSDLIPAYAITLSNAYGADIIITKTTPDEDQIAICKAVQELEQKAHEMARKKRELEQIGLKCK